MTDNEIIKILENEADFDCGMCSDDGENCLGEECASFISRAALDLINRQKAEIEKAKSEAIREFAEKLKKEAFDCDVTFGFGKEHITEAVAVIEIDRLVEEMTEGENG